MSEVSIHDRAVDVVAELLVKAALGLQQSVANIEEVDRLAGRKSNALEVLKISERMLCSMIHDLPGRVADPQLYSIKDGDDAS